MIGWLLSFALAASASAHRGGYYFLEYSPNGGGIVVFDRSSLVRGVDKSVTANVVIASSKPNATVAYGRYAKRYDCSGRTTQTLKASTYSVADRLLVSADQDAAPVKVAPSTVGETEWRYACEGVAKFASARVKLNPGETLHDYAIRTASPPKPEPRAAPAP
jgi:hypothetical protein